jgi:hypothetical protein
MIVALQGCMIVALQGCVIVALQGCVIIVLQIPQIMFTIGPLALVDITNNFSINNDNNFFPSVFSIHDTT